MFLNEENEIIANSSTHGPLSIGIPGTIAGIFKVHEKFGSLTIEEIFKPINPDKVSVTFGEIFHKI